ncbi:putative quinol monooxygenase [Terribacillus saccharophilus]|uniref:putative quinol monooxygenase n=1 Tax=Terribacillus saccharophilus TaxID=361277 RepID=UPI003982D0F7
MITILATLSAKEGKQELLRKVLADVVTPSRSEEGCMLYAVLESEEHDGTFIFFEKWKDDAAFQAHLETEHYKAYRELSEPYLASREVKRLYDISDS